MAGVTNISPWLYLDAAEEMDWQQVVLNGGPPCFHIHEDGQFCGRAELWPGHGPNHQFISLADMIRSVIRNSRAI